MKRVANFLFISADYQNCYDAQDTAVNIDAINCIIGDEERTRIDTTDNYLEIYKPANTVLSDFEKALEGYQWL